MQSLFGPDVQLELALADNRFVKGDKIEGFIKLEAARPLKCRKIQVRLAGVESSTAHGYTDAYTHQGKPQVLSTPGEIIDEISHEFTLEALTDGPISSKGTKFSIDWYVQVDFDVPWAKDPFIRAPIELGES